jgi:hypothetical protein
MAPPSAFQHNEANAFECEHLRVSCGITIAGLADREIFQGVVIAHGLISSSAPVAEAAGSGGFGSALPGIITQDFSHPV